MRFPVTLLLLAALFASACNLNNQPVTPTLPPTTSATEALASPEASVTPLPGINATVNPAGTNPAGGATRTPFGTIGNNSAPTTQAMATTSAFPTPASGESAEITSPANGASVSGAPLYVSGIVHNLPDDGFTLQVFDADGESLTSLQTITLSNPNNVADVPWSASVQVNNYTGAAQIRISARTATGSDAVIGTANVNIVAGSVPVQNPGSASGNSITSPANGGSVSGDPITVTGTAGGIPENQFTLLLLNSSGIVLNSQVITLSGAETNAVPWSASLGTSGYHGQVEIRAVTITNGQQNTIASVTVNLQ
jgi:hypothetical protein